ncbi:MAG: radical SAM protein [Deltaproteobacteria bacterium]|nr:radical SAM protein [Deltaproteobacteria bacterium]
MDIIDQKINALEEFIERKEHLKKTAPLQYLFWESTLRCNLGCLHCGSDCVRNDSTRDAELDGELIKRELRSIAKAYPPQSITFAIIGGEPLVREDIIGVGAYAAELGFNWGITTNGMLLSPDMIRRLKEAKLSTISVSLDGIEADHDSLRNCKGAHKIVKAALRNLLKDRFFRKFDVICCVSKINIDHLDEFMEDVSSLGVPAVRFTPVFSRGRASQNTGLALEQADYLRMLNFIKRQRETQGAVKVYLSEEGYWGPEWECEVRDEFHYCASGIQIGSILHDGNVTGCPSVSRKFMEGNIKETPFVDIWKSMFTRYRGDREKTFSGKCSGCEHWVLCEGGGFHLLDQENASDSFCCLEKIGIRRKYE